MSDLDPNESSPAAQPESADPFAQFRRLNRRTFVGGAVTSAIPLLAIARGMRPGRRGAHAQAQPGTPTSTAFATTEATPGMATPTVGTPVPGSAATPMIGQLKVIDDQRPLYTGNPVQGGELRLLLSSGSNNNYSPAAFRQDFQIMASYLDPLVWIDEVSMVPQPWLAESWKWSKDRTKITYTLRDGIRWHDGERFTAKDVVFSLFVYRDDIDSAVRNLFSVMDFAEAKDDLTVVVTLRQPDGNWLLNASSQLIMQRKQYTKYWASNPEGERTLTGFDWKKSTPVGTGPWKVGKRGDTEIVFSRNDVYWAGTPNFDSMTLKVVDDPEKRLAAWTSGDADLLWPVRATDLAFISTNPGKLYVADAASVMFAAFNFNNPSRDDPQLLEDINIRRALSLAIDRSKYADQVFGGFAFPDRAGTIAQPWGYDPESVNPARDVNAARQLLADSGFKDVDKDGILKRKDGERLQLNVIVRSSARPELLAILDSVVADLAAVGVGLEVRRLNSEQFDESWIDDHDFDLIAYAYNLYPGFTDFDLYGSAWDIRQNPQGWNPGGYANEKVDSAIRDMLEATNMKQQAEALKTLQQASNEDLFGLWFGFPRDLVLVRPDIQGYRPNKQWQTWDTRILWRG